MKEQSYARHTRLDPPFHQVIFPIFAAAVLLAIWNLVRYFSLGSVALLVLAIGALLLVLRLRAYATKLQDRIIRLEERVRLSALLEEPLKSRINELTVDQFIALRFASDQEVPALVEKALNNRLSKDEIKKAIVSWRPDHLRV